jgi:MFS transporter, Spinster family, sphingosine-1-phosphate transporter
MVQLKCPVLVAFGQNSSSIGGALMSDFSPSSSTKTAARDKVSPSYPKYVFGVMFAISFLNYLDRNVMIGAANVIAHELGFGLDGIGYISSAFLVVYTIFTIPLGIWADRANRKNVIALCVAVWSVATALTALSFNFATLFLSRMVLGIGEAGYFPAGTAIMGDYFRLEQRSRVMSWWGVAQLVGILVGYVLGGELAGLYIGSWRLAFLFTGIPGLALAFMAWKLREPRRNEADETEAGLAVSEGSAEIAPVLKAPATNPFIQIRSLLRIKSLVILIVVQIFAFFVLSVAITFLPTFLQQKDLYGLSSGFAGIFSGGVIVIAGLIGTIFGGYLADWLNRRHQGARILVCGIGFLLSAPALLLSMLSHTFIVFSVLFIITTILITMYTGPSTAATQDVAPAALRASAVAVSLFFAHMLGDAFSPTIVGVLARAFDPTGGTHFANNVAGHDLALAMVVTCVPALLIAGLVGIFGARWMKADIAAAQEEDRQSGFAA